MKRIILLNLLMITGLVSYGQLATTVDTARASCIPYNASTAIHNGIKNTNSKKVAVKWTVTNTSLPTGWSIENICDNLNCYVPPTAGSWPPYTGDSILTNGIMDLKVTFILTAAAANGTGIVQIHNSDGANTTNAIFKGWTCAPQGVEILDAKNNFTTIYNPSSETLTVVAKSDIEKYTVEIYNILGSKIKSITSTNSITNINTDNMVMGNYIIRLLNAQKTNIGVKKVTITH